MQDLIEEFTRFDTPPASSRVHLQDLRNYDAFTLPTFRNDRQLRDYQQVRAWAG